MDFRETQDKKHDYERFTCYYCGSWADTVDHVLPRALLSHLDDMEDSELKKKIMGKRKLLVYACRECNNLASNTVQDTITERKKYIKDRIRRRYRKLLAMPSWNEEELSELEGQTKQYILASIKKKSWVQSRLAW